MKKIIFISITILTIVNEVVGQDRDSTINIAYEQYAEMFLNHIQNSEYDKAYEMLDEKLKGDNTKGEFILYFKTISKYYGQLMNYRNKSHVTDYSIKSFESVPLSYDTEFKKLNGEFFFGIIKNDSNRLKLHFYEFIPEQYTQIRDFNKISKKALSILVDKDYKELYQMVDRRYSPYSFDDFKSNVKKLELGGKILYKLNTHSIRTYHNSIIFEFHYELNQKGDIIFEYEQEDNEIELREIRFYFRNEIQAKRDKSFQIFLDTTSLFIDKEILTLEDSLILHRKFTEIYHQQLLEELNLKVNNEEPNISIGISYDWEQLDQSDQILIKESSERYLLKLAKNDIKGFWELCHSKFKETNPFVAFNEVGMLIGNMITSMDSMEFIDGKKVTYSSAPLVSKFATGGSLDKSNPTYLQFYTLAGIENQALSLYKLKNKPLSKTITMKFGLEDSMYKLTSFEINTSSIIDKDADYYIALAKKWKTNNSSFPRFIALKMAYRLAYIGRGTSTSKMIDITEELQTLQKDSELISEIKKWNVNDSIFDIINVDFLETQSDITPNVIYISKVELGETSTEAEVKILFKYFREKYPNLVQEFERFIFTAYEEYPAIPTKQYKLYRVIMNINEIE